MFQSGEELPTGPGTLHVDCSTNSTLYYADEKKVKKIWDGNRINLQMVMLPPPACSACPIAALELMFPEDEEKKNSTLTVLVLPQMPRDFFTIFRADGKTRQEIAKVLGLRFQFSRRVFNFSHLGYIEFMKVMYLAIRKGEAFRQKLQQFIDEAE